MQISKPKLNKQNKFLQTLTAFMLVVFVLLPFFSWADSNTDIYVDANSTGKENGTPAFPYHKIATALQNASKSSKVHVARGVYRENIEIPDEVQLLGENKESTIIEAASNRKSTVVMQDKTKIDKFTVRFGDNGIEVEGEGKISIVNVIVEKSKHDGISIDEAKVEKKNLVGITDSIIRNNERAGIFAEKRKLSLINNEIVENEKDGVDLVRGVDAWIKGNEFENNEGVGLRMELDKSNIWTIKNKFKKNEDGGILVDAYGTWGRIDVARSKFEDNGNFAITRFVHGGGTWNGLTINGNNVFRDSEDGNVSPVINK